MNSLHPSSPEAQAIVSAHQDLALSVDNFAEPVFHQADPTYRHAKLASLALGFIETDAECLAQAWLRHVNRIGRFDPHDWPDAPEDFGLAPWPRQESFVALSESKSLISAGSFLRANSCA